MHVVSTPPAGMPPNSNIEEPDTAFACLRCWNSNKPLSEATFKVRERPFKAASLDAARSGSTRLYARLCKAGMQSNSNSEEPDTAFACLRCWNSNKPLSGATFKVRERPFKAASLNAARSGSTRLYARLCKAGMQSNSNSEEPDTTIACLRCWNSNKPLSEATFKVRERPFKAASLNAARSGITRLYARLFKAKKRLAFRRVYVADTSLLERTGSCGLLSEKPSTEALDETVSMEDHLFSSTVKLRESRRESVSPPKGICPTPELQGDNTVVEEAPFRGAEFEALKGPFGEPLACCVEQFGPVEVFLEGKLCSEAPYHCVEQPRRDRHRFKKSYQLKRSQRLISYTSGEVNRSEHKSLRLEAVGANPSRSIVRGSPQFKLHNQSKSPLRITVKDVSVRLEVKRSPGVGR